MADAGPIVGVVLAGGLARRMGGGDKPLRLLRGRPVLDHIIERFAPQCKEIILNANGGPARFARHGLPVVPDSVGDNPGPLAGILAGLDWIAENRPDAAWMVSVAADCPFLPPDLVARLAEARQAENAMLAVAASGGRAHPVIGLWNVGLRDNLRKALLDEGLRKVDRWTARYPLATATWPAEPADPFFNVNTPEDLQEAERLAGRLPEFR